MLTLSQPGIEVESPKSSREWVRHVVLTALQRGEPPPSQQAIRTAIEQATGTRVSPNLVADELGLLWTTVGPTVAERATLPGYSDEAQALFQQLWVLAVREARQVNETLLASAQTALAEATDQVARQGAELEAARADHAKVASELQAATARLAQTTRLEGQIQDLTTLLTQERAARSADQQAWEALLAERRRELDRLESARSAEMTQSNDLRLFLMQETDRVRTELKGRIETLDSLLAAERTSREELLQAHHGLHRDYAKLQGQYAELQRRLEAG